MFNFNFKKFLLISAVFHLAVLTVVVKQDQIQKIIDPDKKEYLPIVLKFEEEKKERMQIVENPSDQNNQKPIDTKFLSKSDQTVNRQTVTRNKGRSEEARHGGTPNEVEKKVSKTQEQSKLKNLKLSELAPVRKAEFKPKEEGRPGQLGSIGNGSGLITRSSDYVEDIPLGDMTRLNTIEYKYYGFYHRIRQKLEQHWGASLQEKANTLARTGKRIPSSVEKITSLAIVLNDEGKILQIYLRSTSGVKELDEAAMEAFYKAGPFPNPPRGMIKDGVAKIEWGFVVKS